MALSARPEPELLAVFHDAMFQLRQVAAASTGNAEEGQEPEEPAQPVEEFRAPGRVISARLDLMGRDRASTLARLDWCIQQMAQRTATARSGDPDIQERMARPDIQERIAAEVRELESLDGQRWVDRLPSAPQDPPDTLNASIGSVLWLLRQIWGLDQLTQLRALLLAYPDAEVTLDTTSAGELWWESGHGPDSLPSRAAEDVARNSAIYAPVIVLTEGRTDAEFLGNALEILYPHLTDLIRFLDYDRRPEGGAGALVNMVKAFAAAGVVNRTVAVFDNDTAAADALRKFDQSGLPAHIKVIQYPDIILADDYPTLGPPNISSPAATIATANVNKLAGSIELYLGEDVLKQDDGTLHPVQWTSYISGMSRYQGEVTGKGEIQEKFRRKCSAALRDPGVVTSLDWSALHLILNEIREAAQSLTAWIENGIRESGNLSWTINWAAALFAAEQGAPWPVDLIRPIEPSPDDGEP
jgi:hypothetical protein